MKQVSDACYLDYDAIGIERAGDISIALPIERDGINNAGLAGAKHDGKTIKLGKAIDAAILDVEHVGGIGGVGKRAGVVVVTVVINRNCVG